MSKARGKKFSADFGADSPTSRISRCYRRVGRAGRRVSKDLHRYRAKRESLALTERVWELHRCGEFAILPANRNVTGCTD